MNKRWVLVAVFLLSLGYLHVNLNRDLSHYDEGMVDVAATRLLAGELPYRDFFAYYAPGQFYLIAGAFDLYGVSVHTERVLALLLYAALALVVFQFARVTAGEGPAWLAWLLTLAVFYPTGYVPVPNASLATGMLGVMGSLLCLTLFLRVQDRRWLYAAGLAVGLTMLVRYDLGAYAAVGEGLVLAAYLRYERLPLRDLGRFFLPMAVVVVPVAVVFLLKVPWSSLRYDFITFPTGILNSTRHLPYPRLSTRPYPLTSWRLLLDPSYVVPKVHYMAAFYLTPALYLVTCGWLVLRARRDRTGRHELAFWVALLLLLLGALGFNYVRGRPDHAHLMPFALPALLLLPLLASLLWQQRTRSRRGAGLGLGLLGLVAAELLVPGLLRWPPALAQDLQPPSNGTFIVPRAAGMALAGDEPAYQVAIAFVLARVPPQETIFVGKLHHDRIFVNDVMFYFLAERPPATRFHDLVPGVATTASVQREIIQSLEQHRTQWVIVDCEGVPNGEDVGKPGSTLLDDYLQQRFAVVHDFTINTPEGPQPDYLILHRKAGS